MSAAARAPRLEIRQLVKKFGGAVAVDGVDLAVGAGEIVGIVGPNGSGKSTLLNLVTRIERPSGGAVFIDGESIAKLNVHEVSRRGVHYGFQRTRLLPEMSVAEHLQMALADRSALRSVGTRRWVDPEGLRRVDETLRRTGLAALAGQSASELSFGQRQLLCLAMATIREAMLVLLDEPLAGLSGEAIGVFAGHVEACAARGAAVLIVEHRLRSLAQICQRFVVMDHGRIIADGVPAEVMSRPEVLAAYFGKVPP